EQHREGAFGGDEDRRVVDRFRLLDAVELAELRACECGVDYPVDRKGNVFRGQLHAVVEGHDVADPEFDFRIRAISPFGGDLRRNLAGIVARQDIVEDVAVDVEAVGVPLDVRIEELGSAMKSTTRRSFALAPDTWSVSADAANSAA